jgi:hypothetical protein
MSAILEDLRQAHEQAYNDWEQAADRESRLKEIEVDARLALLEAEEAEQTGADMAEVLTLREIVKVCEGHLNADKYEYVPLAIQCDDAYRDIDRMATIARARLAEIEAKARTSHLPDAGKMGAAERVRASKP